MKRAVIYARYSSSLQREESIDAQVRSCREYCKRKGYLVIDIYVDQAKSAKSINKRFAYQQMLKDATQDKFDVIIFHKIDRNARNELDYFTTKDMLFRAGIGYEYATQNIDNSASGQLTESLMVAVAAGYSRNLAEESKKGLKENALKALFNGGTPPLGYDVIDKRYVINQAEAQIVRLVFSMFNSCKSYKAIIDECDRLGYKTKKGRPFGKNSLHDLLKNEKYIGHYLFNKVTRTYTGTRNSHPNKPNPELIVVEDAIPAIIDKRTFEEVREKMAFNIRTNVRNNAKEEYLLSGLLRCGICGAAITGHRKTVRNTIYYYYTCSGKERLGNKHCAQTHLRKEALESTVIRHVVAAVFDGSDENYIQQMLVKEKARMDKLKSNGSVLTGLIQSEQALEQKLNRAYDVIESGDFDEFDRERLKKLKQELTTIKLRISEEQFKRDLPDFDVKEIMSILDSYKDALINKKDPHTLRAFLITFIDYININLETVEINLAFDVVGLLVPKAGLEPARRVTTLDFESIF